MSAVEVVIRTVEQEPQRGGRYVAPKSNLDAAEALLLSLASITTEWEPKQPEVVAAAMSLGYRVVYHEEGFVLADVRARVLRQIGYHTLVEDTFTGYLVLARAVQIGSRPHRLRRADLESPPSVALGRDESISDLMKLPAIR